MKNLEATHRRLAIEKVDGQQLLVHVAGDGRARDGSGEGGDRDHDPRSDLRRIAAGWGISMSKVLFSSEATRPDWPQLGALSTRTGQHWIIRNNIVRYTTGKGIDCGSETWSPESMIATEAEDKHVLIGGHHLVEGNLVTDNAMRNRRLEHRLCPHHREYRPRQRARRPLGGELVGGFRGRRDQSPCVSQWSDRGKSRG